MGIGIDRATADAVMIPWFVEGVAVKVTLVEIKMTPVLQPEV